MKKVALPKTAKSLLKPRSGDHPYCSDCGEDVQDSTCKKITCPACRMPRYCSEKCRDRHGVNHENYCRLYQESVREVGRNLLEPFRLGGRLMVTAGQFLARQVRVGDRIVQMGFHADRVANRRHYFREALKVYLGGMEVDNALGRNDTFGTRAEDRVLCLLVVLGGDAQLLLDWLSSTAPEDEEEGDNQEEQFPSSAKSKEKAQLPLLALHGLFENDTKQEETTLANLYLLACCRSLVDHLTKKQCFDAYKEAINHSLFPDDVNLTVASFLWGSHGYQYGEALGDEIPRILDHIQNNKSDGTAFVKHANDSSTNFSPMKAPDLFSDVRPRNEIPDHDGAIVLAEEIDSVTYLQELWLLYQESFLKMNPGLEALGILPAQYFRSAAKSKKE